MTKIRRLDLDTAKQLAISRTDALTDLENLRYLRELHQDNADYLVGIVEQIINLESYSNAVRTVLRFNQYKELI